MRADDIAFLVINQLQDLRKGFLARATVEFVVGHKAPRRLRNGANKILVAGGW